MRYCSADASRTLPKSRKASACSRPAPTYRAIASSTRSGARELVRKRGSSSTRRCGVSAPCHMVSVFCPLHLYTALCTLYSLV